MRISADYMENIENGIDYKLILMKNINLGDNIKIILRYYYYYYIELLISYDIKMCS